jgi:hypothetical protein
VGAGTHWIRYEVSCYHCEDVLLDQNIRTGWFAAASGYPRILGNGTNDGYFFLARCGSRLHKNVDVWSSPPPASAPVPQRAVVGDSKAVTWLAAEHQLAGLSLPDLHRFTVQLPTGADEDLAAFQLAAHGQPNIYIRYTDGAESGSLRATKLPLR